MTFSPEVYERIRAGCQASAAAVVPEIARRFEPSSVIDVGGGEGWWADEFAKGGCQTVVVDESVEVPHFIQADYEHGGGRVDFYPGDLAAGRHVPDVDTTFDLALCLEVAEHLPADAAAPLVAWLVERAPVVVFSAAIPGQGGHGHLNEQWPVYWADLFAAHGYRCSEYLRWFFWNDDNVEPWYRQNMLVFGSSLSSYGLSLGLAPVNVVHPVIYGWHR